MPSFNFFYSNTFLRLGQNISPRFWMARKNAFDIFWPLEWSAIWFLRNCYEKLYVPTQKYSIFCTYIWPNFFVSFRLVLMKSHQMITCTSVLYWQLLWLLLVSSRIIKNPNPPRLWNPLRTWYENFTNRYRKFLLKNIFSKTIFFFNFDEVKIFLT